MVLTSDMKKETNKERIYDMMKKYYGNDTSNEEEDNYIEEISKSTQATNYVIDNMKEYIKEQEKNASEEKKEEYLIDLFKLTKIRMDSNDEYAEKENIKDLSNMDKINDITSKYFENSEELEMAIKDEKLKGYIDDLKKLVAKFDESTDVFISCINDAIENDEERKIEIYLNELYDAMEYGFIKKDTEKLIKDLKELNKEAEIDYDGYNIESLVSADKLVLPEGYEYDESLGINNKNSTENQNYISIKVNVKANNKGGNYMNNNKDNKTKGKIKPIFRKFKNFFIKEKTDKKERKPKFRKFKKFMLAAGTKISRMPIYIRNKFVSIKDYLEEEISININKDNNTFESSDIDVDEDVDDNNKSNEKDIEDNQNDIDEEKDIQNDIYIDEDVDDNNRKTEKLQNKESDKKIVESEIEKDDSDKKVEELESESNTKKEEESKSAVDNGSNTLTFGEDLNRIDEIRSEIERLQRNMIIIKKNKLRLENAMINIAEKEKNKSNEKEEIKETEENTKKKEQNENEETKKIELIKEAEENSRIEELKVRIRVNNASKFATEGTIKHYEDEMKHYMEKIEMQKIQINKIIDKYNSEFNEAWYGHMGEKITEDLLKRRATLKNQLDEINIKLQLVETLVKESKKIVKENPMVYTRTM